MNKEKLVLHAALGVLCMTVWGCTKAGHQEFMTFKRASDHIAQGAGYQLAPPDYVVVHAPQAPEIDGGARVRHDGTIHLRLLGDVRVAGLTAREAAAKIELELGEYYKEPKVHISVAQYASKMFYLYGEVGGRFGGFMGDHGGLNLPITGRDTILTVLTSNPPSPNAWLSQIKVIRPDPDYPEMTKEMVIDYHQMVTTGDHTQNILLQEGDIVYVPPTPMAWVGYRIRELLQPVAPVLAAYTTPAQIIGATDAYEDHGDDDNDDTNVLGQLSLP